MPKTALAQAFPKKRFFLEMFTRDISLEDCILDLIDNSIDSLIREKHLDPAKEILESRRSQYARRNGPMPFVKVILSENEISIRDNCGGIPGELVLTDVFSFGHDAEQPPGQLGAYGIGLKRAIFKIGNKFEISSRNLKNGFKTSIDVSSWAERDESLDDWTIPITYIPAARSNKDAGTEIIFTELRDEVRMRLRDGGFESRLRRSIGQTYSLFLDRYVRTSLNGGHVESEPIPLGNSPEVKPSHMVYQFQDVKVTLIASLAAPKDEWRYERAGWYVLCNGRVVIPADKTDLTGWGSGLPVFHSKYRGFIGLAIFQSENPLNLPWTTTKRGLNRESSIYQRARKEMCLTAQPIISFLNKMYSSEPAEELEQREIADSVGLVDVRTVAAKAPSKFVIETKRKSAPKTTVKVHYEAETSDIERVRKQVRQPGWSANQVGRHTFEHYLETECPE